MEDIESRHWEDYETLDKIIKKEVEYLGLGFLSKEQLLELHKKFSNLSYDDICNLLLNLKNDKLTEI